MSNKYIFIENSEIMHFFMKNKLAHYLINMQKFDSLSGFATIVLLWYYCGSLKALGK